MVKEYSERASKSYLDSMSIFVSKLEVLKYLKRGEFLDLDKFINLLAENNERVLAYKSEDFFMDIEHDRDYEKAKEMFLINKEKFL